MSSPVAPTQGSSSALPLPPAGASERVHSTGGPVASGPSVSVETFPSHPPQEVLDQMAQAAQRYESLRSQGRELRFSRDERSGRTTIEVRDRKGGLLKTLSPSQALQIAAGGPLE